MTAKRAWSTRRPIRNKDVPFLEFSTYQSSGGTILRSNSGGILDPDPSGHVTSFYRVSEVDEKVLYRLLILAIII